MAFKMQCRLFSVYLLLFLAELRLLLVCCRRSEKRRETTLFDSPAVLVLKITDHQLITITTNHRIPHGNVDLNNPARNSSWRISKDDDE